MFYVKTHHYSSDLKQMLINAYKGKKSGAKFEKRIKWELEAVEHHLNYHIPFLKNYINLKEKKCLDFGAGCGASSIACALQGAFVIGIEPDLERIKIGKMRIKLYGMEKK